MDVKNFNGERLLYELEQFLILNNASDYLHYFLKSMYPRITSGEIIIILAPVDNALVRLTDRSGKTLEKIVSLPEGKTMLENFLSSTPIQENPPVYKAINGAYLTTPDKFDQLKHTNDIKLGNLFIGTIDGIISMPKQLERLQQAQQSNIPLISKSNIIGDNLTTEFDDIPNPVIRLITLNFSPFDIINNCRINARFNAALCDSEDFWNEKTRKSFPEQQVTINGSWKNTYRTLSNKLYTFGSGARGQLGHGDTQNQLKPKAVEELTNITFVACGNSHTAVIANGQLYTFGNGGSGQLGHGDRQSQSRPILVEGLINATMVACGSAHTAVVSNGELYTFGGGSFGKLGHNNQLDYHRPQLVYGLSNVTFVACGARHTAVIANDRLYTFGYGGDGRLGLGNRDSQYVPRIVGRNIVTFVACGNNYTAAISGSHLYTFGTGQLGQLGTGKEQEVQLKPRRVKELDNVTYVACGEDHMAVISNHRLYISGLTTGRPTEFTPILVKELNNVTVVACGRRHTAAVANGQLYTFGLGNDGRLGHNNTSSQPNPTLVEGLDGVSFVACGSEHTAAIVN